MSNIQEEIWTSIPNHSAHSISNHGRVRRRLNSGYEYLSGTVNFKGYIVASIQNKKYKIHRLVAAAYIPNPENKPQVNHKDLNKQNNNVANLEWVTNSENSQHASQNGAKPYSNRRKRFQIPR